MRRVFFSAVALGIVLSSCISAPKNKQSKGDNKECVIVEADKEKTICKKEPKGEVVEVLYFHSKERDSKCRAIENLTIEVINQKFAKELKNGKLQLSIVDISTPDGEKLAELYDVSLSSLFINKWIDGTQNIENVTDLGLSMAESHPEQFKVQIEAKLALLLK